MDFSSSSSHRQPSQDVAIEDFYDQSSSTKRNLSLNSSQSRQSFTLSTSSALPPLVAAAYLHPQHAHQLHLCTLHRRSPLHRSDSLNASAGPSLRRSYVAPTRSSRSSHKSSSGCQQQFNFLSDPLYCSSLGIPSSGPYSGSHLTRGLLYKPPSTPLARNTNSHTLGSGRLRPIFSSYPDLSSATCLLDQSEDYPIPAEKAKYYPVRETSSTAALAARSQQKVEELKNQRNASASLDCLTLNSKKSSSPQKAKRRSSSKRAKMAEQDQKIKSEPSLETADEVKSWFAKLTQRFSRTLTSSSSASNVCGTKKTASGKGGRKTGSLLNLARKCSYPTADCYSQLSLDNKESLLDQNQNAQNDTSKKSLKDGPRMSLDSIMERVDPATQSIEEAVDLEEDESGQEDDDEDQSESSQKPLTAACRHLRPQTKRVERPSPNLCRPVIDMPELNNNNNNQNQINKDKNSNQTANQNQKTPTKKTHTIRITVKPQAAQPQQPSQHSTPTKKVPPRSPARQPTKPVTAVATPQPGQGPGQKPPSTPVLVKCYICGGKFPTQEMQKHESQCIMEQKRKLLEESDTRKVVLLKRDRAADTMSIMSADPDSWEYFKSQLVPCRECGRTFFPHRLEAHRRTCTGPPITAQRKSQTPPTRTTTRTK